MEQTGDDGNGSGGQIIGDRQTAHLENGILDGLTGSKDSLGQTA
jgi:hypothetical protein